VRPARGDFAAHPAATDDLEAVRGADAVFLALKAHSLPETAPRLGALLGEDTAVIAAQNGIPFWGVSAYPVLGKDMLHSYPPVYVPAAGTAERGVCVACG